MIFHSRSSYKLLRIGLQFLNFWKFLTVVIFGITLESRWHQLAWSGWVYIGRRDAALRTAPYRSDSDDVPGAAVRGPSPPVVRRWSPRVPPLRSPPLSPLFHKRKTTFSATRTLRKTPVDIYIYILLSERAVSNTLKIDKVFLLSKNKNFYN